MSRERMSRPTGSVPSRKRALPPLSQNGGASVNSRYCSFGGCGATTSAPSAIATSTPTTASPTSAPRFCAYARQNSPNRDAGAMLTRGGPATRCKKGAASGMPDARVDDTVEHVDDEVDRDDDGRNQQDAALHDRVVARLHAVDEPVAD